MSSLENGLKILSLIDDERPILRVTDVSDILSLPKATVSRTLKALCDANLLERQTVGSGYGIGSRAVEMAQHYYAQHSCLDRIDAALKVLVQKYGFTGHAGKVVGGERILLIAHQGWYPLQHAARIAERKFAFDSIIGQAILARQQDDAVFSVLGLSGPEIIVHEVDQQRVSEVLSGIRKTGVAMSSSLVTRGISSIGTAVADRGTSEIFGFCLSFPSDAADSDTLKSISADVFTYGQKIGRYMRDPFWDDRKS